MEITSIAPFPENWDWDSAVLKPDLSTKEILIIRSSPESQSLNPRDPDAVWKAPTPKYR
jgi:hypothetical protein